MNQCLACHLFVIVQNMITGHSGARMESHDRDERLKGQFTQTFACPRVVRSCLTYFLNLNY